MKSHKAKQQFHFLRSLQIEKKNFSFTKDNIQNGSFFKFDQALRLNTKILSPIRKINLHETFEEIKDCSSLLLAFNKDRKEESAKPDEDCLDYDLIAKEQTNFDLSWKTWKEMVLFLLNDTKVRFTIKKKYIKKEALKPTGYHKKIGIEQEMNLPMKRNRSSFENGKKNEEETERIKENKLIFGNFDENDKPEAIIRTTLYDIVNRTPPENRMFLVSWETRPEGYKPKNSFCLGDMLKEKSPLILLEFYEKNSTFI